MNEKKLRQTTLCTAVSLIQILFISLSEKCYKVFLTTLSWFKEKSQYQSCHYIWLVTIIINWQQRWKPQTNQIIEWHLLFLTLLQPWIFRDIHDYSQSFWALNWSTLPKWRGSSQINLYLNFLSPNFEMQDTNMSSFWYDVYNVNDSSFSRYWLKVKYLEVY